MRPSSAKAKGRRLQQEIRDAILATFPELEPDDVRSTSMGASGEDLMLSPAARRMVPFAIESKNVEAINVWAALAQASEHSLSMMARMGNGPVVAPLLVFRRNHTPTYAALSWPLLLDLLRRLYVAEKAAGLHGGAQHNPDAGRPAGRDDGFRRSLATPSGVTAVRSAGEGGYRPDLAGSVEGSACVRGGDAAGTDPGDEHGGGEG